MLTPKRIPDALIWKLSAALLLMLVVGTASALSVRAASRIILDEGGSAAAALACSATLPTVEYLGEGAHTYVLGEAFDTFIVKQRQPFVFLLEPGTENQVGETVYTATKEDTRVWACAGNCTIPAVYHDAYALGYLTPGYTVNLLVIDDDGPEQNNDQRYNWWAAGTPKDPYLVVYEQQMVEYLTLEIPFAADWYYYAEDSIGIVTTCIEPPPTETPTMTPTATATNTSTPMPSPTATDVPTETPTPTSTATEFPTETPSLTPTATVTVRPTVETPTPTPTAIVRPPPTAIDLVSFTAAWDGDVVVVRWITSYEETVTFGFHLYRSPDGDRSNAERITPTVIPGQGTQGGSYTFTDPTAAPGVSYTYWLQEVKIDGTAGEEHATRLFSTAERIFLPYTSR